MRIVIPAYHAADTILICIRSILRSDFSGEIVVVDDGKNDNLGEQLVAYPVQVIQTKGAIGAAQARNYGATGYTGDILIFIDADVEVEKDTIHLLTNPICQGLSEATVGNYSRNTDGMNFAQKYKQLYISHIYSRRSGYIQNEFWTAIGAIRADIFTELGGFCSAFEPGEDTELGYRLNQKGGRILVVPSAYGKHWKPYTYRSMILNDLRKGIRITSLYLETKEHISTYRHSSRRDILSVALAYALALLLLCCAFLFNPLFVVALLGALVFYVAARADLFAAFKGQGGVFLAQSVLTAFLLDMVRGLCVIVGLYKGAVRNFHRSYSVRGGL